jgi:hypothetical protein
MWVEIFGKWVARHAHAEPEGVGIESRDQHSRALNQFIGEGHVIYIPDSSKTHLQIEIFTILRTLKNEFKGACGSYRLTTCAGRAVLEGDGPFILSIAIEGWRKQKGETLNGLPPQICFGCYIHRGPCRTCSYRAVTRLLELADLS